MYPVSARYKELMRATSRECKAIARIYMGVFDATASPDATLTADAAVSYANVASVNKDAGVSVSYATFEDNRFRLDGTVKLLPDNPALLSAQGWISAAQSGSDGVFTTPPTLTIDFSTAHSLAGLTLTFGQIAEDVPKQITVLSYASGTLLNTQVITDLNITHLAELLLDGVDKIVLRLDSTKSAYGRARLAHIEFGIGYSYSDSDILSIEEKHTDSPVSMSLPTSSLSFTLQNIERRFDLGDTPLVNFLADGQEVRLTYGAEIDGVPELIPGGVWYLSTWKPKGAAAYFTADDIISRLTKTTYKKSVYDWNNHSAGERATAVLNDAGVSDYYLDASTGLSFAAPIPIMSHASALQLLANRVCARLYADRSGPLSIRRQLYDFSDMVFNAASVADRYTAYSDPVGLLTEKAKDYATFEPDYFRLDGTMYLLPDDISAKISNSGMTSVAQADADGTFPTANVLIWDSSLYSSSDIEQVTLSFGGQIPKTIRILGHSGSTYPSKYFHPTKNTETFYLGFKKISALYVWVTEMQEEGQRAHISEFKVSAVSDLTLDNTQTIDQPEAEMDTKLRMVTGEWVWRSYFPGVYVNVAETKITTNTGWARIEHDCAYTLETVVADGTVTVESQHYAFVSYVRLSAINSKEVDVSIRGQKLYEASYPLTAVANDTGEDCPISSPLFDNTNVQNVLDWIRDYYARRERRTLKARGFPEVDCGDLIRIEGGGVAQVIGTDLTYNGAFMETFTLRGM